MGSAISSGTYAKPVKAMYSASIPIIGLHHGASRNGLSAPPRRSQRRSDDLTGGVCRPRLLHHLVSGRDFDQDPGQRRGPSLGDEDSFETAKNEFGLDHNESRSWHGWHRHVSLVILAFAMMAAIRHRANPTPP